MPPLFEPSTRAALSAAPARGGAGGAFRATTKCSTSEILRQKGALPACRSRATTSTLPTLSFFACERCLRLKRRFTEVDSGHRVGWCQGGLLRSHGLVVRRLFGASAGWCCPCMTSTKSNRDGCIVPRWEGFLQCRCLTRAKPGRDWKSSECRLNNIGLVVVDRCHAVQGSDTRGPRSVRPVELIRRR